VSTDILKIPKSLVPVRLWVHPEGQVVGSLFLREQTTAQPKDAEQPLDVLNRANPFLVVKREQPDELRFYNRASIIRVEYTETQAPEDETVAALECQLQMMDGSILDGVIREQLPPDHSRLFDYLNLQGNNFIKIYVSSMDVCLVNKSYIIHARTSN
jgi:hypothetical protein